MTEALESPRHVLTVAVAAAQDGKPSAPAPTQVRVRHHQELVMIEGVDVRLTLLVQLHDALFAGGRPADQEAQAPDQQSGASRDHQQRGPADGC